MPTHTDKIPLSELRWFYWLVFELPANRETTRRELLGQAVAKARYERADALANPPLTNEELDELEKPAGFGVVSNTMPRFFEALRIVCENEDPADARAKLAELRRSELEKPAAVLESERSLPW